MIDTAIPNPTQTLTHAQYPAYKDSGVDWLGEIPAHWEAMKAKYLWKEKMDLSETGQETLLSVSQYTGVGTRDDGSRTESLIGYKKVEENDLVINIMLAWLGGVGLSSFSGVVSPAYAVYRQTKELNPKFLHYLYRTNLYLDEFGRRSKGVVPSRWRMYTDDFGQVVTLLPPLSEQTRIAEFLDQKTAQIDQAIAQKERLIELLNERRQVMIHKAVTRGLNPDAPMKDSGIDRGDARWIGEIPAHWQTLRINWLFTEKDETGYPDLPLLIVSINSGVTLRDMDDDENRRQLAENFNVYKRTLAGDIAFNKMRMWQGAVGVVPQDGLVSPDYVVARPNDFVNSAFYGFLFKTREYLAEFIKHSHGIAWDRNRLYWDDFKNIFAVVPPLEEQDQIVEFLDAQQKEITFATKLIQDQIQKLQELKSTLINSAVTGKIKV